MHKILGQRVPLSHRLIVGQASLVPWPNFSRMQQTDGRPGDEATVKPNRAEEPSSLVPRLSDRTKATKGWGEEKAAANESLVSTVLRFIRFIA